MSIPQAVKINTPTARGKTHFLSQLYHREVNLSYLLITTALYLVATANTGFFEQVLNVYPFSKNIGFILSITGLLFGLMWLVLQLLCYRQIASITNYVRVTFGGLPNSNVNAADVTRVIKRKKLALRIGIRNNYKKCAPIFALHHMVKTSTA